MPGWLRELAGGLPRPFWYLWAGTLINRLGSFVAIFLALYLTTERGVSPGVAGLVVGLYGAGGALGTLAGGVLADRWGRRSTLLTAQVGAATLMLALGAAREPATIAAATFLLGLFTDGARPAFAAMMIDVVAPADRVRAFSLNYWAINLGFAVAAAGAGLAAGAGYTVLFVADAATTALTALITVFLLRETRPPGAAARPAGRGGPGLGTVLRDRVYTGFLLLSLAGAVVMFQFQSTLPIAMSADGLGPAVFGWVIAVNGVLIVAGQPFVPRLVRGYDRNRVMALATAVIGAGYGLVALADGPAVYALTVVVWTLGEMLQSPSFSALTAELSPAALRGRYQGLASLSFSAAAALAPVAGGLVQQHAGGAVLWPACAVVCALAAVGLLVSAPARERRAAALRTAHAVAAPE